MYKALIDKEDLRQGLPSMYTLIFERIKLGRLNEKNKKRKELEKKNPELANKKFVKQPKPPSDWLKSRLGNFELSDVSVNQSVKKSTTIITSDNASKSSPLMPQPFILTNDLNRT